MTRIADLFARDVSRRIEEVIKVDQLDERVVLEELSEYVVTDAIRRNLREILTRYRETPNKPHEGTAIWVSGFFGAGKSSFAKYLGLALENRPIAGIGAAELLARQADDDEITVLLRIISEQIPTRTVVLDLSTDALVKSPDISIIEIVYRAVLRAFGYASDLDLAELELALEQTGQLERFKAKYSELYGKEWDAEKSLVAFAVQEASRVMHELDPATYETVDSWRESALNRANISANLLAERALQIVRTRGGGRCLVVVVDEVGQFVAGNIQRMLQLQGVAQSFGRVGRGRLWLIATSQEKLTEIVGGLDAHQPELARLKDRFPLQVHLEPSDIMEVTSRRVLAKNSTGEQALRRLFDVHRTRLQNNTRLTVSGRYPELSADSFVNLYPLLPYQVDLMIDIVSGLRTAGGAGKHVGGANRTIIKLAQQLLIHPEVNLQSQEVGELVRLDQVYDLVSGNISSEVRSKVDSVKDRVLHPYAARVAKAVCLLQYVPTVPATAENIAATLVPSMDAESPLTEVKEALAALEEARLVRFGENGYRIPTPIEDDWETRRHSFSPKPMDVNEIHREILKQLWSPQPTQILCDVKTFKAGVFFGGRVLVDGEIPFHITFAQTGDEFRSEVERTRQRSQADTYGVYWVVPIDERIDRVTQEIHRSNAILLERERHARTHAERQLVGEEKGRRQHFQNELKRLFTDAFLSGRVFFRGNDRSPGSNVDTVVGAAAKVLQQVLPAVFYRFHEAAARVGNADIRAVLTAEDLRGLPRVFTDLNLLREESGKPVFNTDSGPLAEVLNRIENRAAYGEVATGSYLADEFAKEPFGWDFDVVRLLVASLLRAGVIEVTSQSQTIDSPRSIDALQVFQNNNRFRAASFQPKSSVEFAELVTANENFRTLFGKELRDLANAASVAEEIRRELERHVPIVGEAFTLLSRESLPGATKLRQVLDIVRDIQKSSDERTIREFNANYASLTDGLRRAESVTSVLTEPKLVRLRRAKEVLRVQWAFLQTEPDVPEDVGSAVRGLDDVLQRETFFQHLPEIDQLTRVIEGEYRARHQAASLKRAEAYRKALAKLEATPGWDELESEIKDRIRAPLEARAVEDSDMSLPIPLLRADIEACSSLLHKAVAEVVRLAESQRVVLVPVAEHLGGMFESEDDLDEALNRLREQCLQYLREGKRVLIR